MIKTYIDYDSGAPFWDISREGSQTIPKQKPDMSVVLLTKKKGLNHFLSYWLLYWTKNIHVFRNFCKISIFTNCLRRPFEYQNTRSTRVQRVCSIWKFRAWNHLWIFSVSFQCICNQVTFAPKIYDKRRYILLLLELGISSSAVWGQGMVNYTKNNKMILNWEITLRERRFVQKV